jgi:hypothetical protein
MPRTGVGATSLMTASGRLARAFSEMLAALLGALIALNIPESTAADIAETSAKSSHPLWLITRVGVGCSVLAFPLSPLQREEDAAVK